MDFYDPLAQDGTTPRYAVESDDSDDEGKPSQPRVAKKVVIDIGTSSVASTTLVVAIGPFGQEWLRGISGLSNEPNKDITADGVKIGKVYNLGGSGSTIVYVSHTLPPLVAQKLARSIFETFKPKSAAIIDTYPLPAYISSAPISSLDPPVLYLQTSSASPKKLPTSILPFAPPNLIQSLSASLLSILETHAASAQSSAASGLLLLAPSSHIPPSHPRAQAQTYQTSLRDEAWNTDILELVGKVVDGLEWNKNTYAADPSAKSGAGGGKAGARRRGDVGDGGMYI